MPQVDRLTITARGVSAEKITEILARNRIGGVAKVVGPNEFFIRFSGNVDSKQALQVLQDNIFEVTQKFQRELPAVEEFESKASIAAGASGLPPQRQPNLLGSVLDSPEVAATFESPRILEEQRRARAAEVALSRGDIAVPQEARFTQRPTPQETSPSTVPRSVSQITLDQRRSDRLLRDIELAQSRQPQPPILKGAVRSFAGGLTAAAVAPTTLVSEPLGLYKPAVEFARTGPSNIAFETDKFFKGLAADQEKLGEFVGGAALAFTPLVPGVVRGVKGVKGRLTPKTVILEPLVGAKSTNLDDLITVSKSGFFKRRAAAKKLAAKPRTETFMTVTTEEPQIGGIIFTETRSGATVSGKGAVDIAEIYPTITPPKIEIITPSEAKTFFKPFFELKPFERRTTLLKTTQPNVLEAVEAQITKSGRRTAQSVRRKTLEAEFVNQANQITKEAQRLDKFAKIELGAGLTRTAKGSNLAQVASADVKKTLLIPLGKEIKPSPSLSSSFRPSEIRPFTRPPIPEAPRPPRPAPTGRPAAKTKAKLTPTEQLNRDVADAIGGRGLKPIGISPEELFFGEQARIPSTLPGEIPSLTRPSIGAPRVRAQPIFSIADTTKQSNQISQTVRQQNKQLNRDFQKLSSGFSFREGIGERVTQRFTQRPAQGQKSAQRQINVPRIGFVPRISSRQGIRERPRPDETDPTKRLRVPFPDVPFFDIPRRPARTGKKKKQIKGRRVFRPSLLGIDIGGQFPRVPKPVTGLGVRLPVVPQPKVPKFPRR